MIFKALLRFSNFGLLNKISNSTLILQTKLSSVKTLSAIRGSRKLTLKSQILNKIYSSELFSNFEKTGNNKLNPYLRPKNNTDIKYSFAYEEAVAKEIVEIIKEYIRDENIIVEGNPGLGFITNYLIKLGIKKMYIIEYKENSTPFFQHVLREHTNSIQLIEGNIFMPFGKSRNLLKGLILSTYEKKKVTKVIGVVPNYSFLTTVISTVFYNKLWNMIQAVEFYIVISQYMLNNISNFKKATGRYNIHCMFNFLFSLEIIKEFPRTAFLPFSENLEDKMYLVVIKKKANIFEELSEENLKTYLNFLRVLERSRYNLILQTLEYWMPDCGPFLISKGIAFETQVQDISAEESIKLFNLCRSCEGFQNFRSVEAAFEQDIKNPNNLD